MGFLRNFQGKASYTRLIVTSPSADAAQVVVSTFDTTLFNGAVSRTGPATVNIPPQLRINDLSDRRMGIHISANSNAVSVVAVNVYSVGTTTGTSETYHILPHQNLTVPLYEYYAVSIGTKPSSDRLSEVLLVGAEDNTTVTVYPSQNVSLPLDLQNEGNFTMVQAGQGYSMTLHRLQTLLITKAGLDLTGTRVVSNKPISVFSGHECGNVPNNVDNCDHVGVQVPPTATWGKEFLLIPFLGRPTGQQFKMVSAQNDTLVERTCSGDNHNDFTLTTAGSVYEFHTNPLTSCYLKSNKPLLVVQLGQGFELDKIGDPFMILVSPVGQYVNNASFLPLSINEFPDNFITIITPSEHFSPANILLDGQQVMADWTVVFSNGTTAGYACRLPITVGPHSVQHRHTEGRLSVLVYGMNRAPKHAYGYLAGLTYPPNLGMDIPRYQYSIYQ